MNRAIPRLIALYAVLTAGCSQSATAQQRNHEFTEVTVCSDDYSPVDFCDERHLQEIRMAISTRRPDFNHKYIIVRFEETPNRASYVAVDSQDGKVYPLPFDYFGGFVDKGITVSPPSASVEYRLDNDVICFNGTTYDYRNVRLNQRSCYRLDSVGFKLVD